MLDLETDLELELELELGLDNRERIFLQMQLMVAGRGLSARLNPISSGPSFISPLHQ